MPAKRSQLALRYAVAVAAVGLAALTRLGLAGVFTVESPFMLFLGAVMAAAWYGGLGPGLLATAMSTLVGALFFRHTPFAEGFTRDHELRMGLFLIEGVFISVLAETMHAARRRAERSAAVARELEHTLAEVSEAEQRRIGHDLHDGLGQHLTGIALMSKALQQRLASAGRGEAADAGEVAELANESIDWTRDLARGLAPVDLDRFSLPAALRALAAKTERLCKVPCTYDGTDDLVLPDETTTLNLYRVAQEAVNNAVKHARPRHVRIRLESGPDLTSLTVQDDGIGLAASGARGGNDNVGGNGSPRGKGMGLRIMRYRANGVGARFEIGPGPGGAGTAVVCVLTSSDAAERGAEGPIGSKGSKGSNKVDARP
jgi:signal transduction histidine kinase